MEVIYHVGRHDGGYAYRMENAWSETFPTHDAALSAARSAAARQRTGGKNAHILFETEDGEWHREYAEGGDRPETIVIDDSK
ncbi:DUF2188 domain-containing protein [Martelella mediterranea]|uniref:DUF2188 domain-containing protein n=1 Tax=Martelella mediterranea DSM 17316 TaxID=1122214 RepID=A0A1U9Z3H4_9HYPH|nr:DUF2188 domain-containing protein [Martelella mediterranea]AQZ52214.1 hypothetical protein Mame_02891 [Martelella mediterranea DSM 17316]